MPNESAAEIYRRLNAVEQAISNHVAGCGEQNRARERWEIKTDGSIEVLYAEVGRLKQSDAHMMGWLAGASAIGSVLGAALGAVLTRWMGG